MSTNPLDAATNPQFQQPQPVTPPAGLGSGAPAPEQPPAVQPPAEPASPPPAQPDPAGMMAQFIPTGEDVPPPSAAKAMHAAARYMMEDSLDPWFFRKPKPVKKVVPFRVVENPPAETWGQFFHDIFQSTHVEPGVGGLRTVWVPVFEGDTPEEVEFRKQILLQRGGDFRALKGLGAMGLAFLRGLALNLDEVVTDAPRRWEEELARGAEMSPVFLGVASLGGALKSELGKIAGYLGWRATAPIAERVAAKISAETVGDVLLRGLSRLPKRTPAVERLMAELGTALADLGAQVGSKGEIILPKGTPKWALDRISGILGRLRLEAEGQSLGLTFRVGGRPALATVAQQALFEGIQATGAGVGFGAAFAVGPEIGKVRRGEEGILGALGGIAGSAAGMGAFSGSLATLGRLSRLLRVGGRVVSLEDQRLLPPPLRRLPDGQRLLLRSGPVLAEARPDRIGPLGPDDYRLWRSDPERDARVVIDPETGRKYGEYSWHEGDEIRRVWELLSEPEEGPRASLSPEEIPEIRPLKPIPPEPMEQEPPPAGTLKGTDDLVAAWRQTGDERLPGLAAGVREQLELLQAMRPEVVDPATVAVVNGAARSILESAADAAGARVDLVERVLGRGAGARFFTPEIAPETAPAIPAERTALMWVLNMVRGAAPPVGPGEQREEAYRRLREAFRNAPPPPPAYPPDSPVAVLELATEAAKALDAAGEKVPDVVVYTPEGRKAIAWADLKDRPDIVGDLMRAAAGDIQVRARRISNSSSSRMPSEPGPLGASNAIWNFDAAQPVRIGKLVATTRDPEALAPSSGEVEIWQYDGRLYAIDPESKDPVDITEGPLTGALGPWVTSARFEPDPASPLRYRFHPEVADISSLEFVGENPETAPAYRAAAAAASDAVPQLPERLTAGLKRLTNPRPLTEEEARDLEELLDELDRETENPPEMSPKLREAMSKKQARQTPEERDLIEEHLKDVQAWIGARNLLREARKALTARAIAEEPRPLIEMLAEEAGDDLIQRRIVQGSVNMRNALYDATISRYDADFASVTVKEAIQNAWGAVLRRWPQGEGGEINLKFDPARFSVVVEDNGDGMSPETLEKAFISVANPPERTKEKTEATPGGFGIGIKVALVNAYVRVETCDGTTYSVLESDPHEYMTTLKAKITSRPATPEDRIGTRLEIRFPMSFEDAHRPEEERLLWYIDSGPTGSSGWDYGWGQHFPAFVRAMKEAYGQSEITLDVLEQFARDLTWEARGKKSGVRYQFLKNRFLAMEKFLGISLTWSLGLGLGTVAWPEIKLTPSVEWEGIWGEVLERPAEKGDTVEILSWALAASASGARSLRDAMELAGDYKDLARWRLPEELRKRLRRSELISRLSNILDTARYMNYGEATMTSDVTRARVSVPLPFLYRVLKKLGLDGTILAEVILPEWESDKEAPSFAKAVTMKEAFFSNAVAGIGDYYASFFVRAPDRIGLVRLPKELEDAVQRSLGNDATVVVRTVGDTKTGKPLPAVGVKSFIVHVSVRGVHQFTEVISPFQLMQLEDIEIPFGRFLFLDIQPRVAPRSGGYPFSLSRERLTDTAETSLMTKLVAEILKHVSEAQVDRWIRLFSSPPYEETIDPKEYVDAGVVEELLANAPPDHPLVKALQRGKVPFGVFLGSTKLTESEIADLAKLPVSRQLAALLIAAHIEYSTHLPYVNYEANRSGHYLLSPLIGWGIHRVAFGVTPRGLNLGMTHRVSQAVANSAILALLHKKWGVPNSEQREATASLLKNVDTDEAKKGAVFITMSLVGEYHVAVEGALQRFLKILLSVPPDLQRELRDRHLIPPATGPADPANLLSFVRALGIYLNSENRSPEVDRFLLEFFREIIERAAEHSLFVLQHEMAHGMEMLDHSLYRFMAALQEFAYRFSDVTDRLVEGASKVLNSYIDAHPESALNDLKVILEIVANFAQRPEKSTLKFGDETAGMDWRELADVDREQAGNGRESGTGVLEADEERERHLGLPRSGEGLWSGSREGLPRRDPGYIRWPTRRPWLDPAARPARPYSSYSPTDYSDIARLRWYERPVLVELDPELAHPAGDWYVWAPSETDNGPARGGFGVIVGWSDPGNAIDDLVAEDSRGKIHVGKFFLTGEVPVIDLKNRMHTGLPVDYYVERVFGGDAERLYQRLERPTRGPGLLSHALEDLIRLALASPSGEWLVDGLLIVLPSGDRMFITPRNDAFMTERVGVVNRHPANLEALPMTAEDIPLWQMTRDEVEAFRPDVSPEEHIAAIADALAKGIRVPPYVIQSWDGLWELVGSRGDPVARALEWAEEGRALPEWAFRLLSDKERSAWILNRIRAVGMPSGKYRIVRKGKLLRTLRKLGLPDVEGRRHWPFGWVPPREGILLIDRALRSVLKRNKLLVEASRKLMNEIRQLSGKAGREQQLTLEEAYELVQQWRQNADVLVTLHPNLLYALYRHLGLIEEGGKPEEILPTISGQPLDSDYVKQRLEEIRAAAAPLRARAKEMALAKDLGILQRHIDSVNPTGRPKQDSRWQLARLRMADMLVEARTMLATLDNLLVYLRRMEVVVGPDMQVSGPKDLYDLIRKGDLQKNPWALWRAAMLARTVWLRQIHQEVEDIFEACGENPELDVLLWRMLNGDLPPELVEKDDDLRYHVITRKTAPLGQKKVEEVDILDFYHRMRKLTETLHEQWTDASAEVYELNRLGPARLQEWAVNQELHLASQARRFWESVHEAFTDDEGRPRSDMAEAALNVGLALGIIDEEELAEVSFKTSTAEIGAKYLPKVVRFARRMARKYRRRMERLERDADVTRRVIEEKERFRDRLRKGEVGHIREYAPQQEALTPQRAKELAAELGSTALSDWREPPPVQFVYGRTREGKVRTYVPCFTLVFANYLTAASSMIWLAPMQVRSLYLAKQLPSPMRELMNLWIQRTMGVTDVLEKQLDNGYKDWFGKKETILDPLIRLLLKPEKLDPTEDLRLGPARPTSHTMLTNAMRAVATLVHPVFGTILQTTQAMLGIAQMSTTPRNALVAPLLMAGASAVEATAAAEAIARRVASLFVGRNVLKQDIKRQVMLSSWDQWLEFYGMRTKRGKLAPATPIKRFFSATASINLYGLFLMDLFFKSAMFRAYRWMAALEGVPDETIVVGNLEMNARDYVAHYFTERVYPNYSPVGRPPTLSTLMGRAFGVLRTFPLALRDVVESDRKVARHSIPELEAAQEGELPEHTPLSRLGRRLLLTSPQKFVRRGKGRLFKYPGPKPLELDIDPTIRKLLDEGHFYSELLEAGLDDLPEEALSIIDSIVEDFGSPTRALQEWMKYLPEHDREAVRLLLTQIPPLGEIGAPSNSSQVWRARMRLYNRYGWFILSGLFIGKLLGAPNWLAALVPTSMGSSLAIVKTLDIFYRWLGLKGREILQGGVSTPQEQALLDSTWVDLVSSFIGGRVVADLWRRDLAIDRALQRGDMRTVERLLTERDEVLKQMHDEVNRRY